MNFSQRLLVVARDFCNTQWLLLEVAQSCTAGWRGFLFFFAHSITPHLGTHIPHQ